MDKYFTAHRVFIFRQANAAHNSTAAKNVHIVIESIGDRLKMAAPVVDVVVNKATEDVLVDVMVVSLELPSAVLIVEYVAAGVIPDFDVEKGEVNDEGVIANDEGVIANDEDVMLDTASRIMTGRVSISADCGTNITLYVPMTLHKHVVDEPPVSGLGVSGLSVMQPYEVHPLVESSHTTHCGPYRKFGGWRLMRPALGIYFTGIVIEIGRLKVKVAGLPSTSRA